MGTEQEKVKLLLVKYLRHVQTWHDTVVVFDNVPAEVCEQWGEQLLTGERWSTD